MVWSEPLAGTDRVEASADGFEVDIWRAGIDLASFPRPTGEAAEAAVAAPAPIFPANANPRYLRLTCNAIPAQQVRPFYPSTSLTIFDHAPLAIHLQNSLCAIESKQLFQVEHKAITRLLGR